MFWSGKLKPNLYSLVVKLDQRWRLSRNVRKESSGSVGGGSDDSGKYDAEGNSEDEEGYGKEVEERGNNPNQLSALKRVKLATTALKREQEATNGRTVRKCGTGLAAILLPPSSFPSPPPPSPEPSYSQTSKELLHVEGSRVGLREVTIISGNSNGAYQNKKRCFSKATPAVLCLNRMPLRVRGVNRHEHSDQTAGRGVNSINLLSCKLAQRLAWMCIYILL